MCHLGEDEKTQLPGVTADTPVIRNDQTFSQTEISEKTSRSGMGVKRRFEAMLRNSCLAPIQIATFNPPLKPEDLDCNLPLSAAKLYHLEQGKKCSIPVADRKRHPLTHTHTSLPLVPSED